jgi:hypothetical protein
MRSQALGTLVVVMAVQLAASRRANAQTWDFNDLRLFAGLTADQWKAVDCGNPQARVLETHEKREVAIVGVAHPQAGAACFVGLLQDIEKLQEESGCSTDSKIREPY